MDSLRAVNDTVIECRRCPRLVEWREAVARDKRAAFRTEEYWGRPVPGFGDPNGWLVIVGLAPAAHGANRTGRMFTGDRSGDFLYAALWRAGLANQPTSVHRDDVLTFDGAYITAPVRCAPPANKPTPEERANCRPWLDADLALLDWRVALVLGAFGFGVMCDVLGIKPRPQFAHGLEVDAGDGRTLLCSFHVSQQNTFTGKLTEEMFDAVLARAKELGG